MEIQVKWNGAQQIEKALKMRMDKLGQVVRESMREAADEVAEVILFRGAEDIEEAGNFGDDWVDALHADVTETQRTVRVEASYQPKGPPQTFWKVFEYGATIFAHNERGLLTWPNKSGFEIDGEVPAFISKPSVTIPKKFHLTEIIAEEAKKMRAVFERILAENVQA